MKSDMASKAMDHSMLQEAGFFSCRIDEDKVSARCWPYISDLIDKVRRLAANPTLSR